MLFIYCYFQHQFRIISVPSHFTYHYRIYLTHIRIKLFCKYHSLSVGPFRRELIQSAMQITFSFVLTLPICAFSSWRGIHFCRWRTSPWLRCHRPFRSRTYPSPPVPRPECQDSSAYRFPRETARRPWSICFWGTREDKEKGQRRATTLLSAIISSYLFNTEHPINVLTWSGSSPPCAPNHIQPAWTAYRDRWGLVRRQRVLSTIELEPAASRHSRRPRLMNSTMHETSFF